MTRTRAAATAGLALAGTALVGGISARLTLSAQARLARRAIGKPLGEQAPPADGRYKKRYGDPIRLVVLGDSIAAGLGATKRKETLSGQLARRLAKRTSRAVDVRCVAVVGAETSMLAAQLEALPEGRRIDVALIVVGGNDVIHRVPRSVSTDALRECILALQARGAAVVVGTCPDLGTVVAVPQPLRSLIRAGSRQLAGAQRDVALELGAVPVSLARLVGPHFLARPDEMFAEDRFHPSPAGYRRAAKALLGPVAEALGGPTPVA
ncbi:SGNH/GDSL hydrolase family protein [Nocardioides montaniterrae]